jgi:hypothetical protein
MGEHACPSYTIFRISVASLETSLGQIDDQCNEKWGTSLVLLPCSGVTASSCFHIGGMAKLILSEPGSILGGH